MDFTLEDVASTDGSGKGDGGVEIPMFNIGVGAFGWFSKAFSRRRKIAALEKKYQEKYQEAGDFFCCSVSDPDDSCLLDSQLTLSMTEEEDANLNSPQKDNQTNSKLFLINFNFN